MNSRLRPILILLACLALAPALIQLGADEKKGGGFVTLFNGKNLAGWKTKGNWFAEEGGVLKIEPREGEEGWKRFDAYLWTEKEYGDFILDLEYKHPPKGNSGVFLRVGDVENPVTTGLEVQILDSHGKEEPLGHHDGGGVIKTVGPSKNMNKPAGEWNRMVITCKGHQLKVVFNGEKTIDLDLREHSPAKDVPLKGAIGLQDHGLSLWFRNIRVKEL